MPDVTVHVRSGTYPAGTPLSGAYVALHDDSGVFVSSDTSDVSGNVVFPATTAGDYEIRINPNQPGVVTRGNSQEVTVAAADITLDVSVELTTAPVSSDESLCTASGYWVYSDGTPVVDKTFHFSELTVPHILVKSSGSVKGVIPKRVTAKTDSSGYLVVNLIRGACYSVHVPGLINVPVEIDVPNKSSVDVVHLIFPSVSNVDYYDSGTKLLPATAPTLSMTSGDTLVLDLQVFTWSGVQVDGSLLNFSSSDTNLMTLSHVGDELTLTAIGAGTITISVSRVTGSDGKGTLVVTEPDVIANLEVEIV